MNKNKVEFLFEPKYSPLKRKTLKNEIKTVTQIRALTDQLHKESKIEILNYLINSLSSTTNSITNYFMEHPKGNIDQMLNEFHEKDSDGMNYNHSFIKEYNEITVSTSTKALNLINENSDIRKDNYSIMFEGIKLTLDELLNPKVGRFKRPQKREHCSQTIESVLLQRKSLKGYSKTFNININLNDTDDNDSYSISNGKNNKEIQFNQPKKKYSVPIAISKNDNESLTLLTGIDKCNMNEDIFKIKILNDRLKKKQKEQGKLNLSNKNSSRTKNPIQITQSSLNYSSRKSEAITHNSSNQKQKQNNSTIINLKKDNDFPLTISNYQKKSCVINDYFPIKEESNNNELIIMKSKFSQPIQKRTTSSISSSPKKRKAKISLISS